MPQPMDPVYLTTIASTASPPEMQTLGSEYGSWNFAPAFLSASSRALTFGAGEDITFDLLLIQETGCHVDCFDPTPKAINHVNYVSQALGERRIQLARYKEMDPEIVKKFKFHPVGIWSSTKTLEFYAPPKDNMASFSTKNLHGGETLVKLPCKSFKAICDSLELTEVDLVKLDVEGSEYEAVKSILNSKILPKQLLIEFDEGWKPLDDGAEGRIAKTCESLLAAGYELVHSTGWDCTFLRN